ncbi:Arc family DNA-binding protein [Phytobacter palmae]|uniref:Arc family DNA-binding protein n=1 Tax=Phytobacter palmae TaxID=1855371 RepID=A0ABU9V877_9ENTR
MLKLAAKNEGRSANSEVIKRIEQSLIDGGLIKGRKQRSPEVR